MKRTALIPALLCFLALLGWAPSLGAAPNPVFNDVVLPEEDQGVSTEYGIATALVGGFNVAAILKNTGDHGFRTSPKWGYLGVLGGVLGISLGGAGLVDDRSSEQNSLAVVNLAVGAVATVSGLVAIREAKRNHPQRAAALGAMPVHIGAGVIGGHSQGLGVQLTF